VLYRERLKRIEPWAAVKGTPIARRTCEGSSEPEVQAEPELAQMPNLSSMRRIASPSMNSKLMLEVLWRRFCLSPFSLESGQDLSIAFSSLSRKAFTFLLSSSMFLPANSQAFPRPTMFGTFSVPARRPAS